MAVTAPVPAKRRSREKDNREYFGFARRMLRAYGKRVVAEDPSDLRYLLELRAEMDAVIARTARELHDGAEATETTPARAGWSWAEIGAEVGITKRAAFTRWGAPDGNAE
jgi:hypothetical protein